MLRINIINLTRKRIPPVRSLKKAIRKTLKLLKVDDVELDLAFVSDVQIRSLNQKYKKTKSSTDVLAFNMIEKERFRANVRLLGDIAISLDAAAKQAKIFGSSRNKEIYLYIIHGILHLAGYRDQSAKESKCMQRKQNKILKAVLSSTA